MKTTATFAIFLLAILFDASARAITISTVPIGNPGNLPDVRYVDSAHPNGVGAVSYLFRVGKTEVTNEQYVEFLNAVAATDTYQLYRFSMGSSPQGGIIRSGSPGSFSYSLKPAVPISTGPLAGTTYTYDDKTTAFVTWASAVRFSNWLHNGQPSGPQNASTTEDGAYTLNGAIGIDALSDIRRNAGARWWIPSEDEWYKAAYHKNDGVTSNYWEYPTGTDAPPNNNSPSADTGNSANFNHDGFPPPQFPLTDVGSYTLSPSPYGTFDQGGNLFEWNDTALQLSQSSIPGPRGARGGSWRSRSSSPFQKDDLHASRWYAVSVGSEESGPSNTGFRVATVPELGTLWSMTIAWAALLPYRTKKR